MTRPLILSALIATTACAPRVRTPTPETTTERAVATEVVRERTSGKQVQAYCAEHPHLAVDSIRVHPERIELNVGGAFALSALRSTPAGAADTLTHIPRHLALRSPVAKLEGSFLRATAAGEAELRVRPLCTDSSTARTTVVPVLVRP